MRTDSNVELEECLIPIADNSVLKLYNFWSKVWVGNYSIRVGWD